MQALKTLIDRASEICGNDSQLAKRLGVSRQLLSAMHTGSRKITPVMAAKLADIAGYDLDAALRAATIQSAEGTQDEWLIREIVGKGQAVGAAAMLDSSYNAGSIYSIETAIPTKKRVKKGDSLYIVSKLREALLWSKAQLNNVASSGSYAH